MAKWQCPRCGTIKTVICPNCGAEKQPGGICPKCGQKIVTTICKNCGYEFSW